MEILLYQNCIFDEHFSRVQSGFEPLDFRHNPRPKLREFQIFDDLVTSGQYRQADIVGAVSIRFQAKSLLDGSDMSAWIEANPGHDVYVLHPFPQTDYMHFNNVDRAKHLRGGNFAERSQRVFDRAGLDLDIRNVGRQTSASHGCCSFWFASPKFWEGLVGDVIRPVLALTRSELGSELHDFLYKPAAYYGIAPDPPVGMPFMLERATSAYILSRFRETSAFYPQGRDRALACCLFPFERQFIQLYGDQVDAWDAAGVYGDDAQRYFRYAGMHSASGWHLYNLCHPVDFDHGDPRPRLPWFASEGG